ncbi:hypothetical protein HCN51_45735 [Nonomuraea sp. FMUSA5-5]|uniref:Uncharacterized protein n=1 Tax=Nonomuraea composti TaxID=2720023 RepID=A0ABX1BFY7_9ACTN|nr:hypothetical protein [Nonomuraea sp. FMUSA5-5]NJP96655.1 hypothetical protein [Nonomuraea sp. FMUSA5-5]
MIKQMIGKPYLADHFAALPGLWSRLSRLRHSWAVPALSKMSALPPREQLGSERVDQAAPRARAQPGIQPEPDRMAELGEGSQLVAG